MHCHGCGRINRMDAIFCDGWGTRLTAPSTLGSSPTAEPVPVGREEGHHHPGRSRAPERLREGVFVGRQRLPGLPSLPPLADPEQARFRLFDAVTTCFARAAREQPLVIVLNNLHWADRPSLLLLEFLTREIGASRILVLGTYRDTEVSRQHPLFETLGELTRDRLTRRVQLGGLSQEDVGRFIALAAGDPPPQNLVGTVHRQTEGNPLFVTEVVRLLVQEGELSPAGDSLYCISHGTKQWDIGGKRGENHEKGWDVGLDNDSFVCGHV
jgi:predicted ATPase